MLLLRVAGRCMLAATPSLGERVTGVGSWRRRRAELGTTGHILTLLVVVAGRLVCEAAQGSTLVYRIGGHYL